MDLTVAAIPMYFGGMAAEARALKRRAELDGPSAADYERNDTLASLAMGTGSLFAPMLVPVVAVLRPKVGRFGRAAVATIAGGAVTTAVANRVARRAKSARTRAWAERTAAVAGATTVAVGGATAAAVVTNNTTLPQLFERRILPDLGEGPLPWAAAIVGWDFIYYWNHRFMHEYRHMWAIHVQHHSSERYNLSTALRQTWGDCLGTFVPYGAFSLLGIRPHLIRQARGINLIYQFWIHTDLVSKLGPLEKVLNTPSHHRVHHGANRRYIDRNYGSILICWDRWFGTFQEEDDDEPVVYGLTKNIETFNPLRIATHEFVDIGHDLVASTTWSDRFRFAFASPGWAYARRDERAAQRSAAARAELTAA